MNLRFLETFCCAARLKSFSLAAETLNSSQAAISSRIAALESELQVRLFERDTRGVRLTRHGQIAFVQAEEVLRRAADLRRSLAETVEADGPIRIGVIDTIGHSWLQRFMQDVAAIYPKVSPQLSVDSSLQIAREVRDGVLDLGLQLGPVLDPDLVSIGLGTFECAWVASPVLAFPARELTIADLAEVPLLAYSRGSPPHQEIHQLLREAGIAGTRIYNANSLATTTRLATDGLGIGPLPLATIGPQLAEGKLRVLATRVPTPELVCHAVYRARPSNTLPAAFADIARSTAAAYARTAGPGWLRPPGIHRETAHPLSGPIEAFRRVVEQQGLFVGGERRGDASEIFVEARIAHEP